MGIRRVFFTKGTNCLPFIDFLISTTHCACSFLNCICSRVSSDSWAAALQVSHIHVIWFCCHAYHVLVNWFHPFFCFPSNVLGSFWFGFRHEHPIIPVIKEHRTLAKLLNCTLGSICSLARLSAKTHKHTLHGHWLQTSTATGRLSIEEPNLQVWAVSIWSSLFFDSLISENMDVRNLYVLCLLIFGYDFAVCWAYGCHQNQQG